MKQIIVLLLLLSSVTYGANTMTLAVRSLGSQLAVDINLANDDTISGMQIPLGLGMSRLGLRVDSVSFVGSRCTHFFELSSQVFTDQDKAFLYIVETADPTLDSSPLLPGRGKIATVYMSRAGQPREYSWQIGNERIQDNARDLSFIVWTNRAIEVPCTFRRESFSINK